MSPRRQGKNVGGFQRLGVNIDEGLGHRQPVQQAGDSAVHRQSLQRQPAARGLQTAEPGFLVPVVGRIGVVHHREVVKRHWSFSRFTLSFLLTTFPFPPALVADREA